MAARGSSLLPCGRAGLLRESTPQRSLVVLLLVLASRLVALVVPAVLVALTSTSSTRSATNLLISTDFYRISPIFTDFLGRLHAALSLPGGAPPPPDPPVKETFFYKWYS